MFKRGKAENAKAVSGQHQNFRRAAQSLARFLRLLRFGLRLGYVDRTFHQHSLLLECSDALLGVA
jgi:hypothetical protein